MINKIARLLIPILLGVLAFGEELPKAIESNRDEKIKLSQPKWEFPR